MSLRDAITQRIQSTGPLRLADYIELALYHPQLGYYTRADRRSGAGGDFFTSVDVGGVFGEYLARQFDEMRQLMGNATLDLVEAAAGSGRLSRAVLAAAADHHDELYEAARLTLVERSGAARAMQPDVLGHHAAKLAGSTAAVPERVRGIIFANELLDAFPVHALTMTDDGLREVYVDLDSKTSDRFVERLGAPSDAAAAHLERFRIALEPGWRIEVSPAMVEWVETAGMRLQRGFLVLIDYGHEAAELYSATHATGTLTTYRAHVQPDGERQAWLDDPGDVDITAHVDLTAVRTTAEAVGLRTLAVVDQTYFLLGLGAGESAEDDSPENEGLEALRRRLALKTLLVPGGLGSTHKVLIFGKDVGTPTLRGATFSRRIT